VGGQIAVAEMGDDDLPVGNRRRARGAVKLMNLLRMAFRTIPFGCAAADLLCPENLAFSLIDFEQQQFVVGCVRREKDGVGGNDWRAGAPFGQWALPDDASLLVPDDRQAFFAADAGSVWPAPL